MTYVDGYLMPIRAAKQAAYLEFSVKTAAIYKDHGALRVVDCWPDEDGGEGAAFHAEEARETLSDVPLRTFVIAADARDDEVTVFSWVEWPDKAARDAGLAAALADPRMQLRPGEEAIFEGRRLIAGGFTAIQDV